MSNLAVVYCIPYFPFFRQHLSCFFLSFAAGLVLICVFRKFYGLNMRKSVLARRGYWKRGICTKLSEFDFQILDIFCDNFAHPSSGVRIERTGNFAKIWHAICATPPCERPLH